VAKPKSTYGIYSRQIAEFVRAYWLEHGYGPNAREIKEGVGYLSNGSIYHCLEQMRIRSHLLYEDRVARSFRLPNMVIAFPAEERGRLMSTSPGPARVTPPGVILKRELEARGWTQNDLAEIMGRPSQAISEIIRGTKQVTPETALELAQAMGTSPEFWTNLEINYRLHLARKIE
jgi:addiction module HigA family antidote